MLVTFVQVKSELSKPRDWADEDQIIAQYLRSICTNVRQRTQRKLHWVADNLQVDTSTYTTLTVRCVGHGITSGTSVKISSATVPGVVGTYTATRVDADTLRVTLGAAVTNAAGVDSWNEAGKYASCVIHPRSTVECRATTQSDMWIPQQALPWESLIQVDGWNGSGWTTVDSGEYYQQGDDSPLKAGRICTDGGWTILFERLIGSMGLRQRSTDRNYRLTYWAGATECPPDIELAVLSMISEAFEQQGSGRSLSSESHEGSSVQFLSADEAVKRIGTPANTIANWRAR